MYHLILPVCAAFVLNDTVPIGRMNEASCAVMGSIITAPTVTGVKMLDAPRLRYEVPAASLVMATEVAFMLKLADGVVVV